MLAVLDRNSGTNIVIDLPVEGQGQADMVFRCVSSTKNM
jgi:hypothetical protein